MYSFDHDPMTPAGGALIAELGLDPRAVRDALADDCNRRCPDRPAVFPERRFAGLDRERPADRALHATTTAEPFDPIIAQRPARRRSRGA